MEGIMGRGRALAAMGRANVMSAEEAKDQGYVDYVYKSEDEAEVRNCDVICRLEIP